jgi:Na+-driven multidrug efflux pump
VHTLFKGVLDTPTVTLAVLVATILNTVGDVYLVAYRGYGVLGAAIATSVATIVSNVFLICKGRSLIKQWRLALWTEKWGEGSIVPSERRKDYDVLPFISLPGKDSFRSLVLLAGPIFLVMVAKMVEFWYMTTRANNFGLLSTACHNLLMRIYLFFAVFGDGISQASQTFLPGLFVKKRSTNTKGDTSGFKPEKQHKSSRSKEADHVIQRLSVISASLGVFISFVACYIAKNAGRAFTSDSQLVSLMSTASTYMGANLMLNPLAEMLEGVMIASGEMRYLLFARGTILAMFLGTLRVSVCRFTDIWKTLLLFQLIKIVLGVRFCVNRKKK